MEIKINPDIFNPVYWHVRNALKNPKYRFIFAYGGSSSSKTYSIVQNILFETSLSEGSNTMVLRKYATDIRDSVLSDFKGQIEHYGVNDLFSPQINLIKCENGSRIRFRGLDDSEKIKGLADYKRVYLNELTQFDALDLKQIRKRLRGRHGQQIVADWNPIDSSHWVKTDIIDAEEWHDLPSDLNAPGFVRENAAGDMLLIRTTYLDNYWITGHPTREDVGYIDTHTINDFNRDKKNDFNYYKIYALGEWGKVETGAEFYKSFDERENVQAVEYNPAEPLHLSFDENVSPYMACIVAQYVGGVLMVIDEICLKSPRNTLDHTCTEIIKRYGSHEAGTFIYGDATSRKADVKQQKGVNFFTLIRSRLYEMGAAIRVPESNPAVLRRGLFMNGLFGGNVDGVAIHISPECKNLIEDLKFVKENAEGKKLKERTKDKQTGSTYEKYGHTSDCLDYLVCKVMTLEFRTFSRQGKNKKKLDAKESMNRQINPRSRRSSFSY